MGRLEILTHLPPDTKSTGGRRADMRPDDFDFMIATKGGRFWWSRALMCPCRGNTQTDQADPTCSLCSGTGYFYIKPAADAADGDLDIAGEEIEINTDDNAISVQCWVSSLSYDTQLFERFGQWVQGTGLATLSRHNRIGYRDKLSARDQVIFFSQLIEAHGNSEIKVTGRRSNRGLWVPISQVNILRSLATTYTEAADFRITDTGTIEWLGTPPTSGTLLTIHAGFHPTWIVLDYPYAARDTLVQKKTTALSVAEQFARLPMRATVKLDFLVD